ncbi:MAG: hypothetical protein HZB17_09320, partial [Chloroflexi bacterium]|nr:hypothetical protein [Chloroflexota bacterium]
MSLSYAEMVLVTIYRISNGAADRVAFEDIVIRAWNDFPDHFSLRNHLEYPDAAVVSKRLYGDLITKRLVVSLKNQQYKLSQKGLTEARHLETSDKH